MLKMKRILASSILLPLCANSQGQSYQPPVFLDENRQAKIQVLLPAVDKMYQEFAEKNHYPGYAFGIVLDGKLVYSGSGGYINLDKKIPATPQSIFRIASMSKSFTAMAILQLRDQGKLSLDNPLSLYVPDIKKSNLTQDEPEMSIRHLLTHSAGFPNDDPWGDRKLAETNNELLDLYRQGISYANVPGVQYEYSNLGFTSLGYVIHKVSGRPYQEFITQHILQPLNMHETYYEYAKVAPTKLAHGYQWHDGQWQELPLLHDGSFGAMGGMLTSIEDFSKYLALHQAAWPPRDDKDTGPLKRSSLREMHQAWRFKEFNTQEQMVKAYGYGLNWMQDAKGKTYVGHSGGLPGFGSQWIFMPEYGLGVVFFTNLTYADAPKINLDVIRMLIDEGHLQPRTLPASQLLQERRDALMKFLPAWNRAEESGVFAENFFLDHSVTELKKTWAEAFKSVGRVLRVGEIKANNQLSGNFLVQGDKGSMEITMDLAPDPMGKIQRIQKS